MLSMIRIKCSTVTRGLLLTSSLEHSSSYLFKKGVLEISEDGCPIYTQIGFNDPPCPMSVFPLHLSQSKNLQLRYSSFLTLFSKVGHSVLC